MSDEVTFKGVATEIEKLRSQRDAYKKRYDKRNIEYTTLELTIRQHLEDLKDVAEGRAAFSRDRLEHAQNVIDQSKMVAQALLRDLAELGIKVEEVHDGQDNG